MKKKSMFYALIYGNKAIEICVFFTVATMVDLLACVPMGIIDISYWHLGMRFFLCVVISFSFYVFRIFDRLPLFVMLIIHCVMSILIMVCDVWVSSFFIEIHPHAYRDAVRTILYIYPVIIIGCVVIDGFRTAQANRILKERANASK